MALDYTLGADGTTKYPTRTRTDPAPASGTVEVPEGVTDFLDVSGNPAPVSAANPFPVTASSLPLPTGASTETTLAALNAKVTAVNTGAVVVSTSALPTGAATESTLSSLNAKVTAVNTGAVVLAAGSAKVGQVAIDQTTDGTTNRVNANITQFGGTTLSATNPIPTQLAALYYPPSTGNNTTAQLTAGATFTGTIESIVNQQAAQVSVVCDQPYTLIIDQFQDAGGTKKVSVDANYTFTRAAGVPLCENVNLVGNYFRIRLTNNGASTTTTLSVDITFGIMATNPYSLSNLGNQKTSIAEINGTAIVTGGIAGSQGVGGLAASGAAVSGNPVLIAGTDGTNARTIATDTLGNVDVTFKSLIVTGSLSATGTLIAATDIGDGSHVSVQLTGTFSATVTFEQSNDNSNWVNAFLTRSDATANIPSNTVTTTGIWQGPLNARYFRARVSAYTSGTVTGTADFGSSPTAPVVQVVQLVLSSGQLASSGQPTSDAQNTPNAMLWAQNFNMLSNGTNWDRNRNNHEATVLASAARTATNNSSDQTNFNARGVRLTVNVTALTGTPSITARITGKSTLGNVYTTILQSAAITATGTTVLLVYPGLTAVANSKADDLLPRLWRVEMTHADAQSITYSVDANYIV